MNSQAPSITTVFYPLSGKPVEKTAAEALADRYQLPAPIQSPPQEDGVLVCLSSSWTGTPPASLRPELPWVYVQIDDAGQGVVTASEPALLYAAVQDESLWMDREALRTGLVIQSSFSWNRPLFDAILNQVARTARYFEPEKYIEHLARHGFTHLEVNGLASYMAHEQGVPGEYYSQFYSYGAGLLQFVDSALTRGLYDPVLVGANLQRMKTLAALGRRYGLKPGMFCFEPRTLPERFFHRYPTLRGARVDHPLRSHLPRYTLAQDHPVVREHYRELIANLMKEIPDLAYLSIWTNDSGSGFEHTSSLYAGRNGGPYIIREWKTHEEIARAAGNSAARWLRLLQETGAETNPDFEVSLRIESFKAEHDTLLEGMGNGVTLEAPSLLVRGYDLPYEHPHLPENKGIAGTMFHTSMDPAESEMLATYRDQGIEPSVHYSPCSTFNMEPLLGIPYPKMLHKKLQSLKAAGIYRVNALGGLLHLEGTPFWPHPAVIRSVQLSRSEDVDALLERIAASMVQERPASELVQAWALIEEALSYMPYVPLFSNFGFVWYRLWIRPFVPDIEAIPSEERAYYERFMVTMANNPNMNDLGKDVLFELITRSSGTYMAAAFDRHVEPRFEKAIAFIDHPDRAEIPAFADLRVRVEAARIWAITQRNVCSWVSNVYGYLEESAGTSREPYRQGLQETIDKDLQNTRDLLALWEGVHPRRESTSGTTKHNIEFMLVSDTGETPYIYGPNFGEHLVRKIALTEQYRHHDPFIDPDIIWRIPPALSAFNR